MRLLPACHTISMPSNAGNNVSARPLPNTSESSGETCGFVVHVVAVLMAIAFVLQNLLQLGDSSLVVSDHDIFLQDVWNLLPDWSLRLIVARILVGALVAIPFVYFGINAQSVPKLESLDSLCDEFTRKNTAATGTGTIIGNDTSRREWCVPVVADIDVAHINDIVWKGFQEQR
ncbi:hypothetical protein MPSEU_000703300 [Mayamaea pseudoterrestris]|nr:hypothetical protein MPSEU_000703300 [Mayamaea pseudoterrestris]